MVTVSEILKDIMRKEGLNQKKLAEIFGVTETSMSKYVNGTRSPNLKTWEKIKEYATNLGLVEDEVTKLKAENEHLKAELSCLENDIWYMRRKLEAIHTLVKDFEQ